MGYRKRHFPVFYTIYFLLLILFAVGLYFGNAKLSKIISEYNQGIPETVSKRFFDETFLTLDIDKIIDMSGVKPEKFETDSHIKDFVREQLSGELSYTSVSASGDEKKYIVKSGDYKIATFTLIPNENGDYTANSLSLHLPKTFGKEYTIFSGSRLFVNGIEVGDEHITAREEYANNSYLPDGVRGLEWVTYSVTGFTKEPTATVTDRNGNSTTLIERDGVLCEELIFDTTEEDIAEWILNAAKQYAICIQNDAPKSEALKYFEKGTELYKNIQGVQTSFVYAHSGYSFENESVSEFMRYDDNTVSMRVRFTHLLHQHGKEDYKDRTDITYFARKIDGEYLIYARYNN